MIHNVIKYLEDSAKRRPNNIAICNENMKLTFQELEIEAKKIATKIIEINRGITNKPIAVFTDKTPASIVAFMGIVLSGNYYVPIDASMPMERILKIVDVLEPSMLISTSRYTKLLDAFQDIPQLISDSEFASQIDEYKIQTIVKRSIDTNPLYVLFTSGSTGEPKGVVVSHRAVIDYIEWLSEIFDFDENTIFGNQAPFYFDNSILDIYLTLKHGCTLVLIPERYFAFQRELISFMYNYKVNTIFWVPSALNALSRYKLEQNQLLPELDKVMFCGEVMPVKILNSVKRLFPNALYVNMYGPTEITDVCSYYIVNRDFHEEESLPIGMPCNNTEILVLNEHNQLVEENEVGELCVRGSSLAHGYYGNWEKTEKVFVQNPLNDKYPERIYKTGDLVKYNSLGEIIYIGRKDFQIKHLGHRIELGEIEGASISVKGVKECCCVYSHIDKQIRLICSIEEQLSEQEIYKSLMKKIPKYMLPGKIRIVDQIPKTANGKIDRKRINQEFEQI
ncbi:amino acid adenylation domain-containing protein [Oceanirhabdus seepicola]|uniref:Amino acid adenylation domain-containing protein n=1 Tax=Oceanirhabdus seepicola TaxID=2828781 RepID=A0A9J6P6X8_9CLOT|nr:amino acid adenylation domain-containing protein [Oceanirhabdus seepicola]MCM1992626.1 amino acid adenylation domain-containing protein [Oceanirhabdus seepicola]